MSLEIGFSVIARRVALAGVIRGKRGHMRSEEGDRAMAISALRRRLGVMIVRCQASSLLGRLETMGSGKEVEKGDPGSPDGHHLQLEGAAVRICKAGLKP